MLEKKYSQLFGNFIKIPFSWLPLLEKNTLLVLSYLVYKTNPKDQWFKAGTKKDIQERLFMTRFHVEKALKELLKKEYIYLNPPKRKKNHIIGRIKTSKILEDIRKYLEYLENAKTPRLAQQLLQKALTEEETEALKSEILQGKRKELEEEPGRKYTLKQIFKAFKAGKKPEGMTKEEEEFYNLCNQNFGIEEPKEEPTLEVEIKVTTIEEGKEAITSFEDDYPF